MKEKESSLPDGQLIAKEVDRALRNGKVSETLLRDALSDQCHDELIYRCFTDFPFSDDKWAEALEFLSRFGSLRRERINSFGQVDDGYFRKLASHYKNMTPLSIANRAEDLVIEKVKSDSAKEDVDKCEKGAKVARYASLLCELAISKSRDYR